MAEQSKIEWTDSTFNPWMGCTRISPACDHCYAAVSTPVRTNGIAWGPGKPRQRTSAANWKQLIRWNKEKFVECRGCGWRGKFPGSGRCPSCESDWYKPARRRVFCASLADWLDNEVPIEWLVDLLDLIRQTPNLDWLLLTKRIGNWKSRIRGAIAYICANVTQRNRAEMLSWLEGWLGGGRTPANVWLGATVVNQEEGDRDIPKLLQLPARVRFLSIEPMLGPVSLDDCVEGRGTGDEHHFSCLSLDGLPPEDDPWHGAVVDWVICGGESGPNARPMHPDWVRSLRDQCQAAGVPFLFKQWGEHVPGELTNEEQGCPWRQFQNGDHCWGISESLALKKGEALPDIDYFMVGKKRAGRTLDGKTHTEFPGKA